MAERRRAITFERKQIVEPTRRTVHNHVEALDSEAEIEQLKNTLKRRKDEIDKSMAAELQKAGLSAYQKWKIEFDGNASKLPLDARFSVDQEEAGKRAEKKKKQRQEENDSIRTDLQSALLKEAGRNFEAELLEFDAMWKRKIEVAKDGADKLTATETYESLRRQKISAQDSKSSSQLEKLVNLVERLNTTVYLIQSSDLRAIETNTAHPRYKILDF